MKEHTDSRSRFTLEAGLYTLIALAAAGLRFYHLSAYPLSDAEAREALAAFRFLQGAAGPLPLSPAYAALSIVAFALFGSGEAIARLAPVLAGIALVLTPALFKRELGRPAALVASGLLAISPTFVASSRTAGGLSLAALALVAAFAAWLAFRREGDRRWLFLCAASLGVGLAAGQPFLTGLAALLLGLLIVRFSGLKLGWAEPGSDGVRQNLHWAALALVAAAVGVSTLGLVYRSGLGALGNSIAVWFGEFSPASGGQPLGAIPLALGTYEPLLLVFGTLGLVLAWLDRSEFLQASGYAAIGAYLFLLVFPGRSVQDLPWALIPWMPLAAHALVRLARLPGSEDERWGLAGHMAVLIVLFVFVWLNLAGYASATRLGAVTLADNTRLLLVLATFALMAVISALFAAGWAKDVALTGLGMSAAIALGLYTLSTGWGLTQLRPAEASELWNTRPATSGLWMLVSTVQEVSSRNVGAARDIQVAVKADRDSALGWAFRDFPKATFVADLGAAIDDPVVIAPLEDQSPALGSAYVGQPFVVSEGLANAQLAPANWVDWFVFRRTAGETSQVILWVRQDVQLIEAASP